MKRLAFGWAHYKPNQNQVLNFGTDLRSLTETSSTIYRVARITIEYDDCTVGYECGICSCYHPADWNGDCREDAYRFPAEAFEELIDMDDVDAWQAKRKEGAENQNL